MMSRLAWRSASVRCRKVFVGVINEWRERWRIGARPGRRHRDGRRGRALPAAGDWPQDRAERDAIATLLPGIMRSQDAAEGLRSFTERRQAHFTGH